MEYLKSFFVTKKPEEKDKKWEEREEEKENEWEEEGKKNIEKRLGELAESLDSIESVKNVVEKAIVIWRNDLFKKSAKLEELLSGIISKEDKISTKKLEDLRNNLARLKKECGEVEMEKGKEQWKGKEKEERGSHDFFEKSLKTEEERKPEQLSIPTTSKTTTTTSMTTHPVETFKEVIDALDVLYKAKMQLLGIGGKTESTKLAILHMFMDKSKVNLDYLDEKEDLHFLMDAVIPLISKERLDKNEENARQILSEVFFNQLKNDPEITLSLVEKLKSENDINDNEAIERLGNKDLLAYIGIISKLDKEKNKEAILALKAYLTSFEATFHTIKDIFNKLDYLFPKELQLGLAQTQEELIQEEKIETPEIPEAPPMENLTKWEEEIKRRREQSVLLRQQPKKEVKKDVLYNRLVQNTANVAESVRQMGKNIQKNLLCKNKTQFKPIEKAPALEELKRKREVEKQRKFEYK